MDEIQDLLLLPYFKGVSFVPRSANLATHTLLGWALSIGQGGVWESLSPSWLPPIILKDCEHCSPLGNAVV